MADPIQFYNRLTRRLETESVYGEGPLRFVYENPAGRLALHALVKRKLFSRFYGWRMDQPASRAKIRPFIETFGVDASEFAEPVESYRTFNEFFYRRLKPGARPIDPGDHTVVFPADGRHLAIPDLNACDNFWVKGVRFDLPALLRDTGLTRTFTGGAALISRLCPVDYHRFHFPCPGTPDGTRQINGPLYSVSPIALLHRPSILWENLRWVTPFDSPNCGRVLLLEIGATCVGGVVHTAPAGVTVAKGDEKGYFRFGGSCCITLFERGRVRFADDLLEHGAAGREVYARMGQTAAVVTG